MRVFSFLFLGELLHCTLSSFPIIRGKANYTHNQPLLLSLGNTCTAPPLPSGLKASASRQTLFRVVNSPFPHLYSSFEMAYNSGGGGYPTNYPPYEERPPGQELLPFFIPGDGIIRQVIQTDLPRYLGNNAYSRPGHSQVFSFPLLYLMLLVD